MKESKNRTVEIGILGTLVGPQMKRKKIIIMWDKTIVFPRYTRQMEWKFARWH